MIKLNTLQNEEYGNKHLKHINYKSKINFSPPKILFLKDKNNKKFNMNLKHPHSNKHKDNDGKINYSPKDNTIPKYLNTENNIANINIMNNNNIFINKLDFLENFSVSSRKDNIFSKINNYILKGHNGKDNFINLLNKKKLSAQKDNNSKGNSLLKKTESKEKDKRINLNINEKRMRKIEYNNDINNKNSLFNYAINTTKNLYQKDILLNKKYSFINILKPKAINKLKRYTHININNEEIKNEEKRKENIQENSKLLTINNNKSLTFIHKDKKKSIPSLLKQKNVNKLIQMLDDLNNSKTQSKSKKKNKSSQHINFRALLLKKLIKKIIKN